jgi:hypothetical protein
MPTVTRLTTAFEIRTARAEFEKNVTKEVYDRDFSAIGQGFNVMALIGPSK